jgi:hypothetical protein
MVQNLYYKRLTVLRFIGGDLCFEPQNNIIKDIIKTLSQFGEVNYRMTTDGAEFYRADKLFGKLYNEQLYLLYKTDQLTQVLPEDMNNLQLILSIAYLIAGVG